MKLTYTLTLADYIAAIWLHRAQSFTRRFLFAILYFCVPILAIAGLVSMLVLKETFKKNLSFNYIFAEAMLMLLAVGLPLARIPDVRICFRRIFGNSRPIPTITMQIDEDCVRSEIPGVSEGKFFWNAIVDFAQNEKITLLYVWKRAFLFFPTPILSSEQRTEFNALVARHVVRR